ncbi:MAG: Ppx/GppA family phosphatase [Bacteroidetes bacterium SW_9_63_38]|nr:MAG: Ppx/GppA family phosphatase [Bacteroidetes bacterium SW_9_63_38]
MSASVDRAACILVPETTYASNGSTSPMRVCVIDLGTNSFHAVIVDAHANGSYQIVDRMKEMVRLGQHGLSANTLPEAAMERGMKALKRIHLLAKGWDTEEYLAFATSAIREATNGGEFIRRVRNAFGLRIRPISGEQEAGLIYQGVRRAVEITSPTLLVDIGGGSVEFIVAAGDERLFATSLKLGAARMTERFVNSDPLSEEQEQALRDHCADTMAEVFEACRAHDVTGVVGSSGTIKSLARVALNAVENGSQTVFQRTFDVPHVQASLERTIASSAEERMAQSTIDPKRVDQIGAGAVLLDTILEHLPAVEQVRVSTNALREGMVVHFMDTNYARLRRIAPFRTPRRRSVHELAYRYNWEERHAQHAAATSTFLFDVCRPLYDGPDRDAELLEYASLLHDVGHLVSHDTHARHSRYLIENANLQGFQPDEIAIMSLVARYHRGRVPLASDEHYRQQSEAVQRRVRQLASLVRIAEGLDRSHFQNVTALRARLTDEALVLSIATKGDPQLEVWSGGEEGAMFEDEFARTLQVKPTAIDVRAPDETDPSVSHATVSAPEAVR